MIHELLIIKLSSVYIKFLITISSVWKEKTLNLVFWMMQNKKFLQIYKWPTDLKSSNANEQKQPNIQIGKSNDYGLCD